MIFGSRGPVFDPRPYALLNDWMRELAYDGATFGDLPGFENEDGAVVLRVEVPGLEANDIDVQVHERTVTIRAERTDTIPQGMRILRRERAGDVSMVRTATLPASADPDQCQAELRDGVLALRFSQREPSGPRRITLDDGRT